MRWRENFGYIILNMEHHTTDAMPESGWRAYIPLIVVLGLILIVSIITSFNLGIDALLVNIMAGFFLVFGGFKLLDLKGFVDGYSTYDLLAMRSRAYGYVYPFIEIAFGLLMVSGYHPAWLLITEIVVMGFSGLGVLIKLLKREQVQCVCLGTVLKVPLTSITFIEDFGMAAIALFLLF